MNILHFIEKIPLIELEFIEHVGLPYFVILYLIDVYCPCRMCKSFSEPVLKADGTVDAEASRRVEILFRLKDEEMIREMIEILNAEQVNGQKIELADAPGS